MLSGRSRPNIRRYASLGLAIALFFNLLLLGLHLASRDGQRTVVEITQVGKSYRVTFDGMQALPAHNNGVPDHVDLDGPASGSIALFLPYGAPSLPGPRGIDSVVVTAPDGSVLLRDDFNFLDQDRWYVASGSFKLEHGLLIGEQQDVQNIVVARAPGWGDYTVKVTYRNGTSGIIATRRNADSGDGYYYSFELQRDFPNFVNVLGGAGSAYGGLIETKKQETLRSIVGMATRSYGLMLALIVAGAVVTVVIALVAPRFNTLRIEERARLVRHRLRFDPAVAGAALLAVAALLVTYHLNDKYYEFVAHLPDEVAYLFQAKLLAHGHFTGDQPPVHEAFYFYFPSFLYEHGSKWASFYPYGHPLMLAIGTLFGAWKLVPSLVGAGCVLLIFLVGRAMYGSRVGLVAALLLAASPFFLMQASSFMSHNTAMLYMLVALFFILKRDRPLLYGALAGLAFGLLFNTRPLTAAMLVPSFGVMMLSYLRPEDDRPFAIRHIAAFALGALVSGALALLLYNRAITGDALQSPYSVGGDLSTQLGFSGANSPAIGLRNEQAQLQALLLVLNGWPVAVGLTFVLLPFVLGSRNAWDYFCAAAAVLPMAAMVLYRYSGVYEGPRYWYEVTPFLMLLSARGAELAAQRLGDVAQEVRRRIRRDFADVRWAGYLPAYALLVVLVVSGSGGWLFNKNDSWTEFSVPLVPHQAKAMKSLFGVDARLIKLADQVDPENSLVMVRNCSFFQSPNCYGSVFLRNDINFDGGVVWVRYEPGSGAKVAAAFPGRKVYIATWEPEPTIVPWDPNVDP